MHLNVIIIGIIIFIIIFITIIIIIIIITIIIIIIIIISLTSDFGKAIGPDATPNRVLKDLAPEPLIMDIYNCSFCEGYVPDLLKRSIINPIPKVSPPQFNLT